MTQLSSHVNGDYLTHLPVECQHIIIRHFEKDVCGLHSLLLLNKEFFRLVVPILYESPFTLFPRYFASVRVASLLATFLGSIAHHRWVMDALPPLGHDFKRYRLSSRHILEHDPTQGDDLGQLRPDVQYMVDALDEMGTVQLTTDYLRFYTKHAHNYIATSFLTLFPSLECNTMDQWISSDDRQRIQDVFHRGFIQHNAEHVSSAFIEGIDVLPYTEVVARMQRLHHLTFVAGKNLSVHDCVEFVRKHDALSQSTQKLTSPAVASLRSSSSTDTAAASAHPDSESFAPLTSVALHPGELRMSAHERLFEIISSMQHLQVLDISSVEGTIHFLHEIPMENLRILRLCPTDQPPPHMTAKDLAIRLQDARYLEELEIPLSDEQRHTQVKVQETSPSSGASRLQELTLLGDWCLTDKALAMIASQGCFPHLRRLELQHFYTECMNAENVPVGLSPVERTLHLMATVMQWMPTNDDSLQSALRPSSSIVNDGDEDLTVIGLLTSLRKMERLVSLSINGEFDPMIREHLKTLGRGSDDATRYDDLVRWVLTRPGELIQRDVLGVYDHLSVQKVIAHACKYPA
ncbi:hypothetical protein BG004_006500 [Podila humilis]|nr:hypothetical protein BG004_006500 [Podila humilis]